MYINFSIIPLLSMFSDVKIVVPYASYNYEKMGKSCFNFLLSIVFIMGQSKFPNLLVCCVDAFNNHHWR